MGEPVDQGDGASEVLLGHDSLPVGVSAGAASTRLPNETTIDIDKGEMTTTNLIIQSPGTLRATFCAPTILVHARDCQTSTLDHEARPTMLGRDDGADETLMKGANVDDSAGPQALQVSDTEARLLKAYEVVSAHYRQDISLFWTRSSVFLLVQVGLLALVNAVIEKGVGTVTAFTVMGIGVSAVWFLVARSAVEWMEIWRVQTVEIDRHVNPLRSYRVDGAPPRNFRPTRLVVGQPAQIGQFLPVVFILGWIMLLVSRS